MPVGKPHAPAWQIQQTHQHVMYMAAMKISTNAAETKQSVQQLVLPEALTEASLQSADHDSHQLKAADRRMHALKQPYTSLS